MIFLNASSQIKTTTLAGSGFWYGCHKNIRGDSDFV